MQEFIRRDFVYTAELIVECFSCFKEVFNFFYIFFQEEIGWIDFFELSEYCGEVDDMIRDIWEELVEDKDEELERGVWKYSEVEEYLINYIDFNNE